jgi:hypothetical protein
MDESLSVHAMPLHGLSLKIYADLGQLKYWVGTILPKFRF